MTTENNFKQLNVLYENMKDYSEEKVNYGFSEFLVFDNDDYLPAIEYMLYEFFDVCKLCNGVYIVVQKKEDDFRMIGFFANVLKTWMNGETKLQKGENTDSL